ncbi:MAG TPA: hypothetical protein VFB81_15270, partial [Myxococcales bacterium]|nr:hypothetical protein [Myxococcales bacterium]
GCDNQCPRGFLCRDAACTCPAPASTCLGECVDKNNDPRNCGACGNQCTATQICQDGACACRPGLSRCIPAGGGVPICADTNSDPSHCGACNSGCSTGTQICKEGQCVTAAESCQPGTTLCNSGCVNLHTSASSCGACGVPCLRDELCVKRSDQAFVCGRYEVAIGCNSCPCPTCITTGRACCPSAWAQGVIYCVRDGCPSD